MIDDILSPDDAAAEERTKSAVSNSIEDLFSDAAEKLVKTFSGEAHDILLAHKLRVDGLVSEIRRTAADADSRLRQADRAPLAGGYPRASVSRAPH